MLVQLSLEEVASGVKKTLELTRPSKCDNCSGSGAKPGTSATTCGTCGGAGQVMRSQGFLAIRQPCPSCHGEGTTIESPCPKCRGRGKWSELDEAKQKDLELKLKNHMKDNPLPILRTLDGKPLTDEKGKPVPEAPKVDELLINDEAELEALKSAAV